MLAFHGDQAIKDRHLERVLAHRRADEIAKGFYWMRGKGCAVGCTLEGHDHRQYELELGIPVLFAYLEDAIFEGLPNERAKDFPARVLNAIQPARDLSRVPARFVAWLMNLLKLHVQSFPEILRALSTVETLYRDPIPDVLRTEADWVAAMSGAKDSKTVAFRILYPRQFEVVRDPLALRAPAAADSAQSAVQTRHESSYIARAAQYAAVAAHVTGEMKDAATCILMADALIELLHETPCASAVRSSSPVVFSHR